MEKIKAFFVGIGEWFAGLAVVDYFKQNPLLGWITLGAIAFFFLLLIIIIVLSVKAKKARKRIAKAQAEKQAPVQAETVETEPKPVEEVKIEPVQNVEPVQIAEPVEEVKAEPVKEEVAVAIEKQPKAEKDLAIEEAIAIVDKRETQKRALSMDTAANEYAEDETERIARYKGKWVICRVIADGETEHDEMYFFELHASNGEKLLSSEEYTTYQGALRGIETHKSNILKGNLKITLSKKGDYIFKLLSGKNMLLCMGENYPTKARCQSAIDSTIRFAATAIIDENLQDHVVKVPVEDDTEIAPLSEGAEGKWIISKGEGAEGEATYYFELFANNGEKLLSSEDYTTYTGAVNGIQTHKKNIENGNFRISLTKRGDYIYKLLNGNGQLLCLGEHYKTKRLCQNAVESVKRFAMGSPLLTDSELKK